MVLMLIIISIGTIIFEKKKEGLRNPIFLIWLWWMGWLILSNFNDEINISFKTNLFFLINILTYYLTSIFFRRKKIKNKKIGIIKKIDFILLKVEKLKYIFFIVNIICAYLLHKYLTIENLTYLEYRENLFKNPNLSFEIFKYLLRKLLFYSNLFFLLYYSIGILNFKENKNFKYIFYLLNIVIIDLINGSRSYSFLAIITLAMCCLFLKIKLKKTIISLVGIGVIIILISLLRMKDFSIIKIIRVNLFYYHTIPFALFDKELLNNNSFLYTVKSNGMATLGLFSTLFKNVLDISPYLEFQNLMTNHMMKFVNVGKNELFYYNAFYTIFYNFYLDGGIIFSMIMVSCYSFELSKAWLVLKKEKSFFSFLGVYIYLIIGISSIYFSITFTYYWLLLIIYLILKIFEKMLIILYSYRKKEGKK